MPASTPDLAQLAQSIKIWGQELGFAHVGIAGVDLGEHEQHLQRWLDAGYQGEMEYLGAHGSKRAHPDQLVGRLYPQAHHLRQAGQARG